MTGQTTNKEQIKAIADQASTPVEIFEVEPESVLSDPDIRKFRAWSGQSNQEMLIPELARTILDEQQIQPATVRLTEQGYVLVDGERRKRAVIYLRTVGFAGRKYPDFPLKITELKDGGTGEPISADQAWRLAALSGIQSERFTDLELARMFREARERFGFGKNTAEVAAFFGVSPATITQKEKLLDVTVDEPEVRELVDGSNPDYSMSGTAALQTIAAPKEKRAEVAKKAKEIAAAEQKAKAKKGKSDAKSTLSVGREGSPARIDPNIAPVPDEKSASEAPSPKIKVETSHVRKAIKILGAGGKKRPAPKMREAIELIEGLTTGSEVPRVLAVFGRTFSNWGHGKEADKSVEATWRQIALNLTARARSETYKENESPKVIVDGKVLETKEKKAAAKTKNVAKKTKPAAKKVKAKAKPKAKAKAKPVKNATRTKTATTKKTKKKSAARIVPPVTESSVPAATV